MSRQALHDAAADEAYGWFYQAVQRNFDWLIACGASVTDVGVHFRGLWVTFETSQDRVVVAYTPEPGDLRIEVGTATAPSEHVWDILSARDSATDWVAWPKQNELVPRQAVRVIELWASGMRRHLRERFCAHPTVAGLPRG